MKRSEKIAVEVNSNFHLLYQKKDIEPKSRIYQEYRRKWKENPENFVFRDFPLHLDIESTNACNLACPFCTFKITDRKNSGMMEWELYKCIIDEGREHNLPSIKLSLRGEPLLHPAIVEMVEYAKKSGIIDIYLNTNGVSLSEELSQKLIKAGLNRISISFEGTAKELYEKNRVGAKYEEVIQNIEKLVNCREKNKVNHPKIRIQTVLIPEMKGKLDEYRNFWGEKGVDEVAYLDFEQEPLKDENLSYSWACPQLWQRMSIWYDGTLLPCVHDTLGKMRLGDVRDIKIADAWKSESEVAYRNLHKNGQGELLYPCKVCPLRAGQVRKLKTSPPPISSPVPSPLILSLKGRGREGEGIDGED